MLTKYDKKKFKTIYLRNQFQSNNTVEEVAYKRACLFADTIRSRWNNCILDLWNDPSIQHLINQDDPFDTEVEGESNGLLYISKIIGDQLSRLLFFEKNVIPAISIQPYNKTEYEVEYYLKLLSAEGNYNYNLNFYRYRKNRVPKDFG